MCVCVYGSIDDYLYNKLLKHDENSDDDTLQSIQLMKLKTGMDSRSQMNQSPKDDENIVDKIQNHSDNFYSDNSLDVEKD